MRRMQGIIAMLQGDKTALGARADALAAELRDAKGAAQRLAAQAEDRETLAKEVDVRTPLQLGPIPPPRPRSLNDLRPPHPYPQLLRRRCASEGAELASARAELAGARDGERRERERARELE